MTFQLGIFARTFIRPNAAAVATAVADQGFRLVQFNLSSIGIPTLPNLQQQPDYPAIRRAFHDAGVAIWGLSATYNAIHPDVKRRRADTARAVALIGHAGELGASAVTLCTGTRNPHNMWKADPDNQSEQAWRDLRETLDELLAAAEHAGVQLGVEPEPGNVIADAPTALRLLHQLGADSRHIGIVLDPANLVSPTTLGKQKGILSDAFNSLGSHTVCVQAKDVVAEGEYSAAGRGGLNYDLIFRLHSKLPTQVPIVIQDAEEADVPRTRQFLLTRAAAAAA